MHPNDLWHSPALDAKLARLALTPASWLYGLGWEIYLATYRFGLKRAQKPHRQVVCIGNLQVGGSGKSPLTLFVADLLQRAGREVVVSCSGYGSPRAESATLAPEGELNAREWGDEPAMFRWLRPDLPLIVGRKRVRAAEIAHASFPNSVMLMDDGFQHLPLRKDTTILLDPLHPDNARCLPAGPYREPRWNRKRANLVIPGEFHVESGRTVLTTPQGETASPVRYSVLCAIGHPLGFMSALERDCPSQEGPVSRVLLPDHDPLDKGNLFASLHPEFPVVVTAKDWVKLREREDVHERTIYIARQEVRVEPLKAFESWLLDRTRAEA
ncbi:MAG TPA: tetraacyldisaccharide 4'-kinase [Fimbriimonas sp.]|nr:tetraacyldisaccharide 4'-kinase [Fimbriimonas sp.]